MKASPVVWDIDVRRRFQHGTRRFDLDVRFESSSPRLVLFGPSGAGKSQTLKIIAGLTAPDDGRVVVAGRTLVDRSAKVDVPARERGLAYVFQDYALFPHLTVVQNVAFGLRGGWLNAARGDGAQADPAVARWLAAFDLLPVAQQYPEQLSGGQRQRTALARALAVEPRALLLDEPFAALDAGLRERLRDELDALQAQLGIPLLLITHDEADVRRFGDAVIEIRDGRTASDPATQPTRPAGDVAAATDRQPVPASARPPR